MTRNEIMQVYNVNEDGIITSLGKFEGEPVYAPHFSEFADDGENLSYMEDGCGDYASLIEISDEDRTEFPELGTAKYVLVTENDQGFVGTVLVADEAEADVYRAEYATDDDLE